MRAGSFFGGILLLVLGVLLFLFGTQVHMVEVPKTEAKVLFDKSMLTVGDYAYKSSGVPANVTVFCSGLVTLPSSNESSEINFYVFDKANFQKWQNGDRSSNFIVQRMGVNQLEASFITVHEDTYYFVFDNSFSTLYKKEVVFSASYEYKVVGYKPVEDRTFNSYSYPLIVAGAVLAAYGLIRKPEVRWA